MLSPKAFTYPAPWTGSRTCSHNVHPRLWSPLRWLVVVVVTVIISKQRSERSRLLLGLLLRLLRLGRRHLGSCWCAHLRHSLFLWSIGRGRAHFRVGPLADRRCLHKAGKLGSRLWRHLCDLHGGRWRCSSVPGLCEEQVLLLGHLFANPLLRIDNTVLVILFHHLSLEVLKPPRHDTPVVRASGALRRGVPRREGGHLCGRISSRGLEP